MTHQEIITLIPHYLEDDLDERTMQAVREHLDSCVICKEEVNTYNILFKRLEEEKVIYPSSNLKDAILNEIEREKSQQSAFDNLEGEGIRRLINGRKLLKLVATVVIMLSCFWIGQQFEKNRKRDVIVLDETNASNTRDLAMIDLLDNKSASKRLEAVLAMEQLAQPDIEIINALIARLQKDNNINVRLYTVEALSKFLDMELVKQAFIKAMETEHNPNVQIALIHALVTIKEERAIPSMQELMNKATTENFVKQQLEALIPTMI